MKSVSLSILIVVAVGLVSKVIGFVREIALANYFGTTTFQDLFVIVNTPFFFVMILTAGMVPPFIREYLLVRERADEIEATRLALDAAVLIAPAAAVAYGLAWLFAKPVCVAFAGSEAVVTADMIFSFRIVSVSFAILPIVLLLDACLNAQRRFFLNNAVKILPHLFLILAVIAFHERRQLAYLAGGVMVGLTIQTTALLVSQRRQIRDALRGMRLMQRGRTALNFYFYSFLYFIATLAFNQDVFVDRYMGRRFDDGIVAALNFGNKIMILPYYSLVMPIMVALVPFVIASDLSARDLDRSEARALIAKGLSTAAFFLLPMAVFTYFFREPIIRLIFMRGAFDERSLALTSAIMRWNAVNILFLSLATLGLGLCFSLGLRWVPVIGSLMGVAAKVSLIALFAHSAIGYQILPIGTLIACALLLVTVWGSLERRYRFSRYLWRENAWRLGGAALCLLPPWFMPGGVLVQGVTYLALYGLWCALWKDPVALKLTEMLRAAIEKKRGGAAATPTP